MVEISVSISHPGHQFSGPVPMGWTKIRIIFSTFLVPCIYGDLSRTENRVPDRAHGMWCQKVPKSRHFGGVQQRFDVKIRDFSVKIRDFKRLRAKHRAGSPKCAILPLFDTKIAQNGGLGHFPLRSFGSRKGYKMS